MSELPHKVAVLRAYRDLYRRVLEAVAHSQPASTVARDLLRTTFRASPKEDFDPQRISRTGYFLHKAATQSGMEHRIVRNLLYCKYWKDNQAYIAKPSWTQIVDQDNPQGKAAKKP